MASPLIFTLRSKADTSGAKQTAESMDVVRKSFVRAAESSKSFTESISSMKSLLVGGVLALPMAGFTREALQSEEAVARFGLKLRAMGEDAGSVLANLQGYTSQIHQAGLTQTQFVEALSRSSAMFKSSQKQIDLLSTEMGLSKSQGIGLQQAYMMLGQVMSGRVTPAISRLGVSMHREIKDSAERAAVVISDLTAKFAPLAEGTGTAQEALANMGATIKDLGESVAEDLIAPVREVAVAFNSLDDTMKDLIVRTTLYATTAAGIAQVLKALAGIKAIGDISAAINLVSAVRNMKDLVTVAGFLGEAFKKAFGPLALLVAGAAAIAFITKKFSELNDMQDETTRLLISQAAAEKTAFAAKAGDLGEEITLTDDLIKLNEELLATRKKLLEKQALVKIGGGGEEAQALVAAEIALVDKRIAGVKAVEEAKKLIGSGTISKLDALARKAEIGEYAFAVENIQKKYGYILQSEQVLAEDKVKIARIADDEIDKAKKAEIARRVEEARNLAELKIFLMKDGLDKELAVLELQASKERETMIKNFQDTLEVRQLLTDKSAKEERDIRLKYAKDAMGKELDFALKSKEEQEKYIEDKEKAEDLLRGMTVDRLKEVDMASKEILKTEGGMKALEEWSDKIQGREVDRKIAIKKIDDDRAKSAQIREKERELADAKNRLAELESGKVIRESGSAWRETAKVVEQAKESEKQRVVDLEKELNLLKQGVGGGVVSRETGLTEKARTEAAKVALSNVVNVSITPNAGEISNAVSEKVRKEIEKALAEFEVNLPTQSSQYQ